MTLHLDFGNIGVDDALLVRGALRDGMVSTATPQVDEFEKKFAEYLGVAGAVATNTYTSALQLAL